MVMQETQEKVAIKNRRKIFFFLPFQVPQQLFPFVSDAHTLFTLVEQISEGLEMMYFICTSSNALGKGGKEKMKF